MTLPVTVLATFLASVVTDAFGFDGLDDGDFDFDSDSSAKSDVPGSALCSSVTLASFSFVFAVFVGEDSTGLVTPLCSASTLAVVIESRDTSC